MPLYVCRWQNGDFSVVQANNKEHAIEILDEAANAEGYPLYAISDFMVHFRLTDSGEIELQGFGDDFEGFLDDHIYPALSEVQMSLGGNASADDPRIKAAVKTERNRIKPKTAEDPDTEFGKKLKAETALPTSVVNRKVRAQAREILKNTKIKGKPS
jgi:hypothetical protein